MTPFSVIRRPYSGHVTGCRARRFSHHTTSAPVPPDVPPADHACGIYRVSLAGASTHCSRPACRALCHGSGSQPKAILHELHGSQSAQKSRQQCHSHDTTVCLYAAAIQVLCLNAPALSRSASGGTDPPLPPDRTEPQPGTHRVPCIGHSQYRT